MMYTTMIYFHSFDIFVGDVKCAMEQEEND